MEQIISHWLINWHFFLYKIVKAYTLFSMRFKNISANSYIVNTILQNMRIIKNLFFTQVNIRSPLSNFSINLLMLIVLKLLQIFTDISDKIYLSVSVIISCRISVKSDPVKSSQRLYLFTNQYTCILIYIYN